MKWCFRDEYWKTQDFLIITLLFTTLHLSKLLLLMLVNWELLFYFFSILFPFSCFFFKIKKCKIWNVNSLQALNKQERRQNPIQHWTEDYRKGKYWFFSCKPFTYSHCVVLLCMFALRHIEFTLTLKLYGVFTPCFFFYFFLFAKSSSG